MQRRLIAFLLAIALVGILTPTAWAQNPVRGHLTVYQGVNACLTDTGAANAYVCNLSPAITAYFTGTSYSFIAANANTGVSTLALNGLAAITMKKVKGAITTDLAANDIRVGQVVVVYYDGTNFQMTSSTGNTGVDSVSNSDGTLTISPTTGAVVASLALGHANTWTADQTFSTTSIAGSAQEVVALQSSGNTANNGPAANFYILDNAATKTLAAQIAARLVAGGAGALKADLAFGTTTGSVLSQHLWLYNSGAMSLNIDSDPGVTGVLRANQFNWRDTSAAHDLFVVATSSTPLTADRGLTLDMGNAAHTLAFGTTGHTITFPTESNDTVAMLNVAQTFTQKQTVNTNAATPTVVTPNYTFAGFGADGATAGMLIQGYNAAAAFIFTRANGTGASPTVLGANNIFSINGRGFDGSAGSGYSGNAAQILFAGGSTWSTTNHETFMAFSTTPLNSVTLTEAMRIFSSGGVGVGTTVDPTTGWINSLNGYKTNNTAGVNCPAGVTAATVVVVGGIVTHC